VIRVGQIEIRFRLEAAQTGGHFTMFEYLIPANARVHQLENLGVVDGRGLSVITPGLLGPVFFREVADVLNVGGPPDIVRIGAIMRRHGLRPAQQGNP